MQWLKQLNKKEKLRLGAFSAVPGFLAGFLLEMGRVLEAGGSVRQMGLGSLARMVLWGVLFTVVLMVLLPNKRAKEATQGGSPWQMVSRQEALGFSRKWFLLGWGILFLSWVPAFLAYYPALWTYDVWAQVPAIRGIAPTTHQPLLHTLYVETLVQIGSKPGNYEVGMALLSLSQMLALSGMISYAIEFTRKWGLGKWGRCLLLLFSAIFPVHAILSVSVTKDVLFSGCFLVCCIKAYDMLDEPQTFFCTRKKWISFLVFAGLMCLLRSNGIYVFVVWTLLAVWLFHKEYRSRFLALCLSVICLFLVTEKGLEIGMGAEEGPAQEAYCVPMQCLVGTAIRHPELIPEDGAGELLLGVVPRDLFSDDLEKNFDPHLADPVKERWQRMDREDFSGTALLKTWIAYGLQYPLDYMDIWGSLTLGAWYPFDETHAYIYASEGERQGYLLTDFKYITEMEMERPESKWPAMERLYEKIATENVHQDIPGISLLFAPATWCWLLFFCMIRALYLRKYRELIPMGLLFLYWGTVMLGPTILVRYLYPVMLGAPFVLARTN